MGSGARAYRMAAGSLLADQQSYLRELQATKEDVTDVLADQMSSMDRLIAGIKGQSSSPRTISAAVANESNKGEAAIFSVIAIGVILFLAFK